MQKINVSIVYAKADKQWLEEHVVNKGVSVGELVLLSDMKVSVPELSELAIDEMSVGIFGKKAKPDDLLQEGDRVEIYRPLTGDPKEIRRKLALLGKTMGKAKP